MPSINFCQHKYLFILFLKANASVKTTMVINNGQLTERLNLYACCWLKNSKNGIPVNLSTVYCIGDKKTNATKSNILIILESLSGALNKPIKKTEFMIASGINTGVSHQKDLLANNP